MLHRLYCVKFLIPIFILPFWADYSKISNLATSRIAYALRNVPADIVQVSFTCNPGVNQSQG